MYRQPYLSLMESFADTMRPSNMFQVSRAYYKILKTGKAKLPKTSDRVRVHYKGTRIDGTVFDSSYSRGQPVDFSLQGVVPGFAEGLTKVGEGGEIIFRLP